MSGPIVALLTDFGWAGPYVGAMKGALLTICPDAVCVDITHVVPPQDVAAGAAILAAAVPHYPDGTIFVAVVDPGVGTSRAALAAASGPYVLIGPDNGLLAPAFDVCGGASLVVSIETPRYVAAQVSATFEGRDRFAPAAGWLARGTSLDELGPRLSGYRTLAGGEPSVDPAQVSGAVVWVDTFGNLVTNIRRGDWARQGQGRTGDVFVGTVGLGPPVRTYADLEPGGCGALFGSSGALEIAVRDGSAAARFGTGAGLGVRVVWR